MSRPEPISFPVGVAYVLPGLGRGGTEKHVADLASRLDRRRFAPCVISTALGGPMDEELGRRGVPVFLLDYRGLSVRPGKFLPLLRGAREFFRGFSGILAERRVAILHAYLPAANILGMAAAVSRRTKVRIVRKRALCRYKEGHPVYSLFEDLANVASDAVMVNSLAVAQNVRRSERFLGGKVFLVYNGLDVAAGESPGRHATLPSDLGLPPDTMPVTYVANIREDKGEVRSQFHHVVDIAPTVLEAATLPQPTRVNGIEQRPMDGVSMLYTMDDAKAADRRKTQYSEMFGNRAIYHEGWVAATRHSIPWLVAELPTFDKDRWELYNVAEDFSQANDLAAQNPRKLKELQDLFTREAVRNRVFPLDDRRVERFDARIAGRPDLVGSRTTLTLGEGMTGITENAFINIKGRSHAIKAEIEVPPGGANGVIIAQAGRFGGWSLYMKGGSVHQVYNFGSPALNRLEQQSIRKGAGMRYWVRRVMRLTHFYRCRPSKVRPTSEYVLWN